MKIESTITITIDATIFKGDLKNLYKLSIDDDIIVTYGNKDYKYKIKNIYLEQKDGDIAIKRNKNKTTLTLVTCTKGDNKTQTIYICELED